MVCIHHPQMAETLPPNIWACCRWKVGFPHVQRYPLGNGHNQIGCLKGGGLTQRKTHAQL